MASPSSLDTSPSEGPTSLLPTPHLDLPLPGRVSGSEDHDHVNHPDHDHDHDHEHARQTRSVIPHLLPKRIAADYVTAGFRTPAKMEALIRALQQKDFDDFLRPFGGRVVHDSDMREINKAEDFKRRFRGSTWKAASPQGLVAVRSGEEIITVKEPLARRAREDDDSPVEESGPKQELEDEEDTDDDSATIIPPAVVKKKKKKPKKKKSKKVSVMNSPVDIDTDVSVEVRGAEAGLTSERNLQGRPEPETQLSIKPASMDETTATELAVEGAEVDLGVTLELGVCTDRKNIPTIQLELGSSKDGDSDRPNSPATDVEARPQETAPPKSATPSSPSTPTSAARSTASATASPSRNPASKSEHQPSTLSVSIDSPTRPTETTASASPRSQTPTFYPPEVYPMLASPEPAVSTPYIFTPPATHVQPPNLRQIDNLPLLRASIAPTSPTTTDVFPTSRPWTLYFSDTSDQSRVRRRTILPPTSAEAYSGGLVLLFTIRHLEDLFGRWLALRRKIAIATKRQIEPPGADPDPYTLGLGLHCMSDDNNFHFFVRGITPMWEDPLCARGGKFMYAGTGPAMDKLFVDVVHLLISGQIEHACPPPALTAVQSSGSPSAESMVVGAILSRRKINTRIEVWVGGSETPSPNWLANVERFFAEQFPRQRVYGYKSFEASKEGAHGKAS